MGSIADYFIAKVRINFDFCIKIEDMGVFVKAIPTLKGSTAEKFIKQSEENLINKGTVDFTEQFTNSKAILEKKAKSKFQK